MMRILTSSLRLSVLTAIALTGGTLPRFIFAHEGDNSLVHACVNGSGNIRIVGPNEDCVPSETPIHLVAAKNGFVGIGTTNPNTKLHVNGTGVDNNGSTAVVRVVSGNGAQNLLLDGNEIDAIADGLFLNNNTDENIVLANGGGKVGVGITNPNAKVHVDAGGSGSGVVVDRAGSDGVRVVNAGNSSNPFSDNRNNGFEVGEAENMGLMVHRSRTKGVWIAINGNPLVARFGLGPSGFEVGGTEGNGLNVGAAEEDGVHIFHAGDDGIEVDRAGNYAAVFGGPISAGFCAGCLFTAFGLNAGQSVLAPGDVVAVQGVSEIDLMHAPVAMKVDRAVGPEAVIGVVAGRAELITQARRRPREIPAAATSQGQLPVDDSNTEDVRRLVPREGPSHPGEYLNIVTGGLVRVRASAEYGKIRPGARLTAADEAGRARGVRTPEEMGLRDTESSATLGIALESLETGEDLIWVFVNPR